MQDEGIGGQLEPEMGGAAAPAQPQQPRTYADRIAMGASSSFHVTLCAAISVAQLSLSICLLHWHQGTGLMSILSLFDSTNDHAHSRRLTPNICSHNSTASPVILWLPVSSCTPSLVRFALASLIGLCCLQRARRHEWLLNRVQQWPAGTSSRLGTS